MDRTVSLHTGHQMPLLGLGTWHHGDTTGQMAEAVKFAIRKGYRHIDCAYCYGNEKEMGAVFGELVGDGRLVSREEMYITSKLWCTEHGQDRVEAACRKSLQDLGLEYLDLYIVHWPTGFIPDHGNVPRDENGKMMFSGISIEETWQAMEKLVDLGLVRAIGLSNYNSRQILKILDIARIRPAVVQVESNPRFNNEHLRSFLASHSIQMVAFSPFGSPDLPWGEMLPHILADSKLLEVAASVQRSPAQVVLRWQIQRGVAVIPKSVIQAELEDNLKVWGWSLSKEQMEVVSSLETGVRKIVPLITMKDGETRIRDLEDINYPFHYIEGEG